MVVDASFLVAVVGLASAIGAAAIALRSKKIEVGSVDLSSIRSTITTENESLRSDNRALRSEIGLLNAEIAGLRVDIRELSLDLDGCRRELATERRLRRAGDAGLAAEHKSADAGSPLSEQRQAGRDARNHSSDSDESGKP